MRRRTLLVALVGLAVVGAAGVVVLWLWPRPERVTRENYDRIQIGMGRREVEAILGPPGDYRTGRGDEEVNGTFYRGVWEPAMGFPWGWNHTRMSSSQTGEQAYWVSDSVRIYVFIDDAGHVREARAYKRRLTEGPLENILWRVLRHR
jgi:hypothetical protein